MTGRAAQLLEVGEEILRAADRAEPLEPLLHRRQALLEQGEPLAPEAAGALREQDRLLLRRFRLELQRRRAFLAPCRPGPRFLDLRG